MDFIKRQMFFILCGTGAIGGIALGVTGVQAMPKVKTEMTKAKNLYDSLSGLESRPANQMAITATKRRIRVMTEDHDAVIKAARAVYHHKPLVEGVFPDGSPELRRSFRQTYRDSMEALMKRLQCGGPADNADIRQMESVRAREKAEALELRLSDKGEGPSRTKAGVLTKKGAKEDPVARAHMVRAQKQRCYCVGLTNAKPPEEVPSLFYDAFLADTTTGEAPGLEEVWRGQVEYWVQEDIVNAIVAVNEDASQQLREAGKRVWIGTMPVKEVISIRPSDGYLPEEGEPDIYGGSPEGYDEALPPSTPATVFTQNGSNAAYDVVQIAVKLVMDQRDIPRLVKRITNNSFYTALRVAYKAVKPNRNMKKKIYGSEPAVIVVMDFEFVMLGSPFREWMPDAVCDAYEINCPERE